MKPLPTPGAHGLTLAMKEQIRQQSVAYDGEPGEPWWCGDCLADLPADPMLHGSHICGDAVTVERAFGGLSFEVIGPQLGDLVWHPGTVPPGWGRLYEVSAVTPRGLRLWDMGNALDVQPSRVQVVRKATERGTTK